MKRRKLKIKFEDICNEYIEKFVKKHGYEFSYWVGDDIGGMACFIDQYFFSLDDIRQDINRGAIKELIFRWQDDCVEFDYFRDVNFNSYIMGLRPKDIKQPNKKKNE